MSASIRCTDRLAASGRHRQHQLEPTRCLRPLQCHESPVRRRRRSTAPAGAAWGTASGRLESPWPETLSPRRRRTEVTSSVAPAPADPSPAAHQTPGSSAAGRTRWPARGSRRAADGNTSSRNSPRTQLPNQFFRNRHHRSFPLRDRYPRARVGARSISKRAIRLGDRGQRRGIGDWSDPLLETRPFGSGFKSLGRQRAQWSGC